MKARRVLLWALMVSALAGAGCKGKCRSLSEKLCDCADNSSAREICLRRAASEESRLSPTEDQEALCDSLLERCDCSQVNTVEGKRACGLIR
jgi:hypothetical protein